MATIGIVGAGTMGRGIAHVAALSGFETLLYDLSEEILKQSTRLISAELKKGVEKGKLTAEQAETALRRIKLSTSLRDLSPCDAVIEAAIEDLGAKRKIFADLVPLTGAGTLLATNTSSLSITAIAAGIQSPERFLGLHFFNPPHLIPLVEVVPGSHTSEETVQSGLRLVERLGKHAIVAKDTPGVIVNRL